MRCGAARGCDVGWQGDATWASEVMQRGSGRHHTDMAGVMG